MATVYGLICVVNHKKYIGCTRAKPSKRLREHRCLLRAGRHLCKPLQDDWNSYGEAKFEMIVLAQCADDLKSRRVVELKWLNHYRGQGELYNEHVISFRPSDEAIRKGVANAHLSPGNRWTPETSMKRRLAQLGKPKNHGWKISLTKQRRKAERKAALESDEIV